MTMRLPVSPLKLDYEDMVVAALIAHGFYVEGRLVFKQDTEEILELDAIATPVTAYNKRYVVEVKSGKWGNPDMFKLAGQVQYTGNEAAWLVALQAPDAEKAKSIRKISTKLPVECIYITRELLLDGAPKSLFPSGLVRTERASLITIAAWWSRIADRVALDCFRRWYKSIGEGPPGPAVDARKYHDAVESSLFERTPLERARALYGAYRKSPNISIAVSGIGGGGSARMREAWETSKHMHVQYLMTLESRSRLAIVKNAYDQIVMGTMPVTQGDIVSQGESDGDDREGINFSLDDLLPKTFIAGFRKLQAHPYPERVPYFFQTFVEVLGGFYFPNSDDDCQLVAEVTTMPREQILPTLQLLNDFFQTPRGWCVTMNAMLFIKAVPAYMRGIGCWIRGNVHGANGPRGLSIWHNALYEILKQNRKDLDLPAPET